MREAGIDWIQIRVEDLIRDDSVSSASRPSTSSTRRTGEVILECNEEITEEPSRGAARAAASTSSRCSTSTRSSRARRCATRCSPTRPLTQEEAIIEIYRRLRPGDPPTLETATNLFHNLFFNPERYDLSRVGRLKLNHKLAFDARGARALAAVRAARRPRRRSRSRELPTLRPEDILAAVKYLVDLKNGADPDKRIDDIDHLGNRRVRVVGELLENQYRIGLVRMERAIKERMSLQEIETLMPHDLINSQAGLGGDQGVLRLEPALAVHGPDEPALGDHAQAPPLGARAGRSHARARRLRGARRAPDALRPHLPDRDAGRSEHRSDRVALDLRARERLRLHRDAVPRRCADGRVSATR